MTKSIQAWTPHNLRPDTFSSCSAHRQRWSSYLLVDYITARVNMFGASRSECAASTTVSIYGRAARMRREHDTF